MMVCSSCGKPLKRSEQDNGLCDECDAEDDVREDGASDPRPDPRTHPEYWTE